MTNTKLNQNQLNDYNFNYGLSRQAIINGNFDVWQRGTSIAMIAANAYTADMWYCETATAGTAPSGSPNRKEFFWIDGNICHVRGGNYGWTAGATVTGAVVPLPFAIATQYQYCDARICVTDNVPPTPTYAYVRNNDITIVCSSVSASYIGFSADYYY